MKNLFACLALATLCAGCIPLTNLVHYQPAMENAVIRPNHCVGSDYLEYKVAGTVIRASIQQWPASRDQFPVFRATWKPAEGTVVEPASLSAIVTSPHLLKPVSLEMKASANVWAVSLVQVPDGDLTIQLPPLVSGGVRHELPLMRFSRKRQLVTVVPLNC